MWIQENGKHPLTASTWTLVLDGVRLVEIELTNDKSPLYLIRLLAFQLPSVEQLIPAYCMPGDTDFGQVMFRACVLMTEHIMQMTQRAETQIQRLKATKSAIETFVESNKSAFGTVAQ